MRKLIFVGIMLIAFGFEKAYTNDVGLRRTYIVVEPKGDDFQIVDVKCYGSGGNCLGDVVIAPPPKKV